MQCPKCSTAMSSLEGLEFSADRCNGCGGVWLSDSDIDAKDHAAAIDSIDTSIPEGQASFNELREINCPNCDVALMKMLDKTQLNVEYEACPDCRGAFFDAGELKDLSEFTLIERLKLTWETVRTNLK